VPQANPLLYWPTHEIYALEADRVLLHDVLTVEADEQIAGVLDNKPNDKNKRDLDIKITYRLETDDMHRQAQGKGVYKM